MAKILGSWSAMREYLEKEMLCEDLQGKVRYECTSYPNMDECKIFRIYINSEEIKRFSHETVNSYFISNGLIEKNSKLKGRMGYWEGYWKQLADTPMNKRTEYNDEEFCDALSIYRSQDIKASLYSENHIVVMFALLDRRVGKRTLNCFEQSVISLPKWLQNIYRIRVEKSYD